MANDPKHPNIEIRGIPAKSDDDIRSTGTAPTPRVPIKEDAAPKPKSPPKK